MTAALRVLVAVHGHPALNKGGSEVAAMALYERLQQVGGLHAWFLGCDYGLLEARPGPAITQPFSDERQFVYAGADYDLFRLANRDPRFPGEFAALLRELRPDVLHLHHVLGFGVEAAAIARRTLPGMKIVLTLHDFMPICHHDGQMIRRPSRSLCQAASLVGCHACFPEFPASDFFIRQQYIMRFLDEIDVFLSPSKFLAGRFAAAGLPSARLMVVANLRAREPVACREAPPQDGLLHAGFFGQFETSKGLDVLLDAAAILLTESAPVAVAIHGYGRGRESAAQAALDARIAAAGRNVVFHGQYEQHDLDRLMSRCHVVVVPSVWWENAPTVIIEALCRRVAVICSDIGGMAELVANGIDGFHFGAGSAAQLARLLNNLARSPEILSALTPGSRLQACSLDRHLEIYHLPGCAR